MYNIDYYKADLQTKLHECRLNTK